jgi:hypothetical protein
MSKLRESTENDFSSRKSQYNHIKKAVIDFWSLFRLLLHREATLKGWPSKGLIITYVGHTTN